MSFVAVAVVAVGAGVSAYGTMQNAKAVADANAKASKSEYGLYLRQNENLDKLVKDKEDKLYNIGNIFDRFESTGAFGDTETLKNLRKAQNDFSQLAAGDFSGFESQLKKSLSDSLVGTMDSGSPVGTYAGLAADTKMNFRKEGIQTSVGISEFLSNESQKLLGQEFGIMDQKFNTGYQLDSNWVNKTNGYKMGEAATVGVGTQAIGGAIQTVGSSLMSAATSGAFGGVTDAAISQAPQGLTVVDGASRAYIPNTTTAYPMSGNLSSMAGSFAGSAAQSYSNQRSTIRTPISPQGGYETIPSLPGEAALPDAGLDGSPGPWRSGYVPFQNSVYGQGQNNNSEMVLPPKQSSASVMSSIGSRIAYS